MSKKSRSSKLTLDAKRAYRLREYAILENHDGTYAYMAWQADTKTGRFSWLRGNAVVLGDILALTSITEEGDEKTFKTMKEVRKALKKLPDWWEKTRYYCLILGGYATMLTYCVSGKPVEKGGEDYRMILGMLRENGVGLMPEAPSDSPGIAGIYNR